jgi:excisionase family DNA binding protein
VASGEREVEMRIDSTTSTMLTVREVSQLLHVHSNTLRRWSDQGVLKAYRIGPRGDRRFKPEDIAVLLLEQTREVSTAPRGNA